MGIREIKFAFSMSVLISGFCFSLATHSETLNLSSPLKLENLKNTNRSEIEFKDGSKPKVIFIWASWCDRCYEFSKTLSRYAKNKELEIISVGADDEKKNSFTAQYGKYAELSRHSNWISPESRKQLGVTVLPVIALVDKHGAVDTIYVGSQNDKVTYFEKRLAYLMNLQD